MAGLRATDVLESDGVKPYADRIPFVPVVPVAHIVPACAWRVLAPL